MSSKSYDGCHFILLPCILLELECIVCILRKSLFLVLVCELIPLYLHLCRRTSLSVLMMETTKSSLIYGQTVSPLRSWIQILRLWAWSLTSTFISLSTLGGDIFPHTYEHQSLHNFNAYIFFCGPAFFDYWLFLASPMLTADESYKSLSSEITTKWR